MNGFDEIRFPEDISYGAIGGPRYFTDIVSTSSGGEYRNINYTDSKMKFNIAYGIKTKEQIDKLLLFFRARMGRAIGFRYKDWSDFTAKNQLIGVGDGSTTRFQLKKIYKSGNSEFIRIIEKPVYNSVSIYFDDENVAQKYYSIDYTTGNIEFTKSVNIGAKILINFEFDVPVRFDIDYLPISIDGKNLYSCKEINLVEIKL
jgi:uncharacterized protein (TIGR02217 family)